MADLSGRVVALASDHAGFALKEALRAWLLQQGVEVKDLGPADATSIDYPDQAHRLAEEVESGQVPLGVLVCGTGLGMSMAANRHPGVRAAVCTDAYTARMARQHNDANVLCLGARVIGGGLAEDVVHAFLSAEFEGGRHVRRLEKIELT